MKRRRASLLRAAAAVVFALAPLALLRADVATTPGWRLGSGISTAVVQGGAVYVGGTFSQLFTPSTSQDQVYDLVTGQPRTECARSTAASRELRGTPDGFGGLLVVVQAGDAFADGTGVFAPPVGTTIVRVAANCQWDRNFAATSIDPSVPSDLNVGLPVRVGSVVYAANSVVDSQGFLRAQVATFDASSGARLAFQIYTDTAEIGLLGAGPTGAVARVRARGAPTGQYVLGSISPFGLGLNVTTTALADEVLAPRFWVRNGTLYRARPAPSNVLEAFDLFTLQPKSGWTSPVVPALVDLEVVGSRVFLTSDRVNGTTVPQPSALVAATGAIDTTWAPAALTRIAAYPSGTPYTPVLTALATDGTRLYFSGDMERVGGIDHDGVAAVLAASGAVDPWTPASQIAQPLDVVSSGVVMSRPTSGNRLMRRYLAAVDRVTGVPTAWNPNDPARQLLHVVSPVSAVAADAAFLYFASATTGEIQRASLASGDVDQNWRFVVTRGGQRGSITTMIAADGTIYLAGDFDAISGVGIGATPRNQLAAVGADRALRPWAPALSGPFGAPLMHALLALDGTVYLGGGFTSVNNQFRFGFAAVDAVAGQLVQPELFVRGDTRIRGLATDGTRVFVAGESFDAPFIAGSTIPTAQLEPFDVFDPAIPTSAAFVSGRLYAGLEYDTEFREPSGRATRWNTVVGAADALLNVDPTGLAEYYVATPGAVPGAPTLAASVSGSVVSLSWAPGAGGPVSSYTIYVGSTPGGSDLATFPMGSATSFSTGAPNGGYYVRVVARNVYGTSPASNEVFVRVGPPPCTLPPTAPSPLTFTRTGTTVTLSWGTSTTAAGYRLDAGSAPGASNLAVLALGNVTSFFAAPPAGTYYVRVLATSACGISGPSNEVTVTLDGATPLPLAPTGLAASVAGSTVSIRWTSPASGGTPSGYRFEAGYTPGASNAAVVATTAPAFGAAGVPPGTYYVRVRAFNAAGTGPATPDLAVVVP